MKLHRALAASAVTFAFSLSANAQSLPPSKAAASQPDVKLYDFNYTEQECKSKNGWWGSEGPRKASQRVFCHLPSPDEGKVCQSSHECIAGLCSPNGTNGSKSQKVEGHCSKFQVSAGCITRLEGGKVQPTICYD